MNRTQKRFWSILLSTVMVIIMLPSVTFHVSAASLSSSAIRLDANNSFGIVGSGTNWVYFGKYNGSPIKWRVLSTNKNGIIFQDSGNDYYTGHGLFLMSDISLGKTKFKIDNSSNLYQGSDLQAYCNTTLYNSCFTVEEQATILYTSKSDPAVSYFGTSTLVKDKLFSLSVEEATNSSYGFNSSTTPDSARLTNTIWQLRSPHSSLSTIIGVVDNSDGSITQGMINSSYNVRPAFNMNLSTVLFTSAAQGGKSLSSMSNSLTSVPQTATNTYKLTLLDNTRKFGITTSSASVEAGGTVSIDYSGATYGTNEYISAMLVDADDNVLYYGRVKAVADSSSENGTANINIPISLASGGYTLKLFSEQYNGDLNTDYASIFQNVTLSVLPDTTAPTVQNVTPSGMDVSASTNSLSVTFSEAIDTTTAGTVTLNNNASVSSLHWSSDSKTVTYNLSGLVYSKTYTVTVSGFKDNSGNVMTDDTSHSFTTLPMADLAVTITDGVTAVGPGETVTYTITVTNSGPSNAAGATVACTFPAAMTPVMWTAVGVGGSMATPSGSGNINDTVNLPAGGSVIYTVLVNLNTSAAVTFSATATVTAPGNVEDPDPGNNSAIDTDTLLVNRDASLSNLTISQGVLSPVFSSNTYTYTALVANNVTSLTVTPTVHEVSASVNVNGTTVSSGNASGDINLVVGANTVTLIVTAQDGTTTLTYNIIVSRMASSGSVNTSPSYNASVSRGGSLPVSINPSVNNASITMNAQVGGLIAGGGDVTIKMPSIPDVSSYSISVPAACLTTPDGGFLTFDTDVGGITVPADMLSGIEVAEGKDAQITIGQGDKSGLSTEVQSLIGNRPIIQLSLTLDGIQTDWNNPNAPVTIRVPYTPTSAELQNPDSITLWYIDGNGKIVCVPSGHYDATIGMVVFTTTHFSQYAIGYRNVSFNDVSDSAWYAEYVSYLAARGIVGGTGDGKFNPGAKITRAQFVTILANLSGVDLSVYKVSSFADVKVTDWYFKAVEWAYTNGITKGANGKFDPDADITRQDIAVMIARYAEKSGFTLPKAYSAVNFADSVKIASYASNAVMAMQQAGIISGNSDGSFAPTAGATRAETAKMIACFCRIWWNDVIK